MEFSLHTDIAHDDGMNALGEVCATTGWKGKGGGCLQNEKVEGTGRVEASAALHSCCCTSARKGL
jgi:hypothetical protein